MGRVEGGYVGGLVRRVVRLVVCGVATPGGPIP